MDAAPFHTDLADGPDGGRAYWLRTDDGVQLRASVWDGGEKGTVLIYPGRCEYIEKYGRTARVVVERGYTCTAIDWRGQGLSDRLLKDPSIGHVSKFTDYQKDVAAYLAMARQMGLPEPYYLLAHSMGGCIGLRHLIDGSPFPAASFSAPMWGITIATSLRKIAHVLPLVATRIGLGGRRTPTTGPASYQLEAPFENNMLTTDPEMWAYMNRQVREEERFRLGGPSLTWLAESLFETRSLAALPRPDVPAHASVGDREKIVDTDAIVDIMGDWPGGTLTRIEGAEHELLLETPEVRSAFLERTFATFEAASAS